MNLPALEIKLYEQEVETLTNELARLGFREHDELYVRPEDIIFPRLECWMQISDAASAENIQWSVHMATIAASNSEKWSFPPSILSTEGAIAYIKTFLWSQIMAILGEKSLMPFAKSIDGSRDPQWTTEWRFKDPKNGKLPTELRFSAVKDDSSCHVTMQQGEKLLVNASFDNNPEALNQIWKA